MSVGDSAFRLQSSKATDSPRRIGVLGVAQIAAEDPVAYENQREFERQLNQALGDINSRVLKLEDVPILKFPRVDVFERFAVGYATLSAGICTVFEPKVGPGCFILVTHRNIGGTAGHLSAPTSARVTSRQFNITSDNVLDTSEVEWILVTAG